MARCIIYDHHLLLDLIAVSSMLHHSLFIRSHTLCLVFIILSVKNRSTI
jgi:hypothetical protein